MIKSCAIHHTQTVTTRYVIKNNGVRRIPTLYVEHTARADRGGFVIKSAEHRVKQVTGWARYCLAVEPEAEVTFEVMEEASYDEALPLSDQSIGKFLSSRAK